MTEEALNHADDSTHAAAGAHINQNRITFLGRDLPLHVILTAFAIAVCVGISLEAWHTAYEAEREARLAEYYGIDLEVYIAKQHLTPPADPWRGKPNKE